MFSKKDYDGYFRQLGLIEVQMIDTVDRLLAEVAHKRVRAVLSSILDDELQHACLVVEMRRILSEGADR